MNYSKSIVKNKNYYKLFRADCFRTLELLNKFNIKVDCIIVDVPYNINYQNNDWDNNFNVNESILLSQQLLKDNGNFLLFQGWSNVSQTVQFIKNNTDLILQNWIVYDRIKGRGGNRNFTSTREDILWMSKNNNYTFNKIYSNIPKKTKGLGTKNGQQNRSLTNVWYDLSPIVPWSKEKNNHPTQKPLQLLERLVTIFSNENDTILDFCMGSGTTGVAALKLNRNFIGIEKEKEWFELAEKRIKNELY